jgi:mannose/cellobiose epimerase-like protein (N-acyl-D-glucosamine 2-epimerase family)
MPTPAAFCQFASQALFPVCRDRFRDPLGGFHERLDYSFRPLPLGRKRLLVQCRQLYVLSEAALAGDRSGQAAAEAGYDFLRRRYWDKRYGGWFFATTPEGAPLDRHKDLYGHAFALFALAYLHRAFAAPDALRLAEQTMELLEHHLSAPNGGFWERAAEDWSPDTTVRRQNPHMHLLEAMLALYEASGSRRWLDRAARLLTLFTTRLYHSESRTLGEHFATDWSPHAEHGHVVEPGHHFEWVWLLHRYAALSGEEHAAHAAAELFALALAHGFDPEHGGIHDQIDRQGRPVLTTRRIWPVTEGIKACIVRAEAGDPDAARHAERLIGQLFSDFLHVQEGRWYETLGRDGAVTQTELPGTTPYHLFLAAREVGRTRIWVT